METKQSSVVVAPWGRVYFAPVRQPTRDRLHRDRRQDGKGTWRAPLTISELVARARKYLRRRLIEIETRLVSDLVSMRETAAGEAQKPA
jgi:hypothetical protein